ncbi:MAG: hypothetical protein HUJ94_00660 [Bacteroidales bacterium]|nr:hypothetical protein [Bacteroidales bacterium]
MEEKNIKSIIEYFEKLEEMVMPSRQMTPEESLLYYYMKEDRSVSVVQEISLAEPIDIDVMQHALTLTIKRFPYFKVKAVFINDRPYYVHNDKPLLLYKKYENGASFRHDENNGYLFRFEVDGNKLFMYNAHSLTDGRGKLPLVQTLLTLYYGLMGIENSSNYDSRYLTMPDDIEQEWANPFEQLDKEVPNIQFNTNMTSCFMPPVTPDARKRTFAYCMEIPVNDLMGYCKRVGGTPNTFLASALAEAIHKVHPNCYDSGSEIKIGVIMDTKPFINSSLSSICAFTMAVLPFSEQRKKLSENEFHSSLKRELREQATPESMAVSAKFLEYTGGLLQTLPAPARRMMAEFNVKTFFKGAVTAAVSYAGQSKLGDISSHVEHVRAVVESSFFDILMEVNCTEDLFCVAIAQSFDTLEYVYAFKEYLTEVGIRYFDRSLLVVPQIPFSVHEE